MSTLKDDLRDIPSWVWLGAAAAGALLFLITHLGGKSAAPPAADPLASQVDAGTPAGASGSTADPMSQFLAELAALQGMSNPASGPAPTQPPLTTNQNPNNIGLPSAAYNPLPVSEVSNGGLLPTTSQPTATGLDTAYQAIQNQLGVYGGAPVSQTAPYAGQGLGSTWDQVTQTTYAGGGQVTNLGIAQPAPSPGQVVPPAVQTPYSANPYSGYTYSPGFTPGQTQTGSGSVLDVLAQEVASGMITQAQANQSRANMGL